DDERPLQPCRLRAIDHRFQVRAEYLVCEVAMRVDHFGTGAGIPSTSNNNAARRLDARAQRILVPGGGGWSKDRSSGLPSSGLAARIMPLDSMPISFAGFRLNAITTVRPTSASGS